MTIVQGSHNPCVRMWSHLAVAYLGRYTKKGSRPRYESATSVVWKAVDLLDSRRVVALKVVKNAKFLEREIIMRQGLDAQFVLQAVRVHVPITKQDQYSGSEWLRAQEPSEPGSYVLVMAWAEATLSDELRTSQIAGIDVTQVQCIINNIANALHHMHQHG